MHVPIAARVHLRVPDPRTRAHPLGQTRIDDPLVPDRIVVLELPAEHPGDDLHVLVRMGPEPRAGIDHVVVTDQQQPVMGIRRIIMIREAEAVIGIKPPGFRMKPLRTPSDVNHGMSLLSPYPLVGDSSGTTSSTRFSARRTMVIGARTPTCSSTRSRCRSSMPAAV